LTKEGFDEHCTDFGYSEEAKARKAKSEAKRKKERSNKAQKQAKKPCKSESSDDDSSYEE